MASKLPKVHWYVDAKCKDTDFRLFMSHDMKDILEAKAICSACPVKEPCLEMYGEVDCVTAGTTFYERLVQKWHRITKENDNNFR